MTSKKTIMPSVRDLRDALTALKRTAPRQPFLRVHVAVMHDRWFVEPSPETMVDTGAYAEAYTVLTLATRAEALARDIVTSLRVQYLANPSAPPLPHLRYRTRHVPKEPDFVADLSTELEGDDPDAPIASRMQERESAAAE